MENERRPYDIRCPIHGFVKLSGWEREVINQSAFQRLRRIRQLAWTDYVYPGAMHTRFEHSLGVMHVATLLYDSILRNSREVLEQEYKFSDEDFRRNEQLVRLAALLHDVGHSPFSHASEDLFPEREGKKGKRHKHEEYSIAIILGPLADVIASHPANKHLGITPQEVASLIEGNPKAQGSLFWKDIIAGQLDADRMDYLNRDSHHLGVQYGRFDLNRVVTSMVAVPSNDQRAPRIGVDEGGWRAAESLVLARYAMFTQVYFHKTRIAYDIHLGGALKEILPGGYFPKPSPESLADYLRWDDWKVLGALSDGQGGEHGRRLIERNHYRKVFGTSESNSNDDVMLYGRVLKRLGELVVGERSAEKSWYKVDTTDIPVLYMKGTTPDVRPLSQISRIVKSIEKSSGDILLYVKPEDVPRAIELIDEVKKNEDN